ncbi:MAG: phage tail sheath subtilisin-like domain-containing protein [Candidatus Cybelea sp.]
MTSLAYQTPGVYKTTPAPLPPALSLVRTDIAGFVGYAERGPLPEDFAPGFDAAMVARRLTSWAEFQSVYGSFLTNGYLAYAVQGFFATGGDTCYVVRVAATRSTVAPEQMARAASFPLPTRSAQAVGALASPGGAFTAKITLTAPLTPQTLVGARVVVTHPGLNLGYTVLSALPDGSLLFSEPLNPALTVGDPVAMYSSAIVASAKSRGAWGNQIQLRFTALDHNAFALSVAVDSGPGTLPAEQEFYSRLVLDPTQPNDAVATLANQSNLITFSGAGNAISFDEAGPLGGRVVHLGGGRDGLTGVTLQDFTGSGADRRGLRLLEEINEIGMIAVPDAVLTIAAPMSVPAPVADPCSPQLIPPPQALPADPTATPAILSDADRNMLQMLMIEQCERLNFRIALLDPPMGLQVADMVSWPTNEGLVNQSSAFAAIYYPWLTVAAQAGGTLNVPPSGYVSGAYAFVDLSAGVQNPPANVDLTSVLGVAENMSDARQGPLNAANVNVIRDFPGRGVRIWGARSLALDDAWRYIHIRRLISAIEETLLLSSRWAVFETNNTALRKALTHSASVLVESIWRKGGLTGSTAAESFYVKCDDTNNPQSVVDAGQVICEVGVAAAAPMEFLVFQVRQDLTGGTVVES